MSLVIKLLFYLIFAFIIYFITTKIYKRQKSVEQHMLNMIIFSKIYFIFAIVLTLIFMLVSIFPINIAFKGKIVLFMIAVLFLTFIYLLSFLYSRWYIDVKDDVIEYCSLFGKTQSLRYESIKGAEVDENNILHIYLKDEKRIKLSIQSEAGQDFIINKLRHQNISVKYKYSSDSFVMKLPLLYPIMHICCVMISVFFTIVCVKMNIPIGSVMGFILIMSSVYAFLSDIVGRVVVNKNTIYQYRFLRRVKKMDISEIIRVDRREKDNVQYVLIYSESGLEMEINMLCRNANLLEQIIKQHRWED